MHSLAWTDLQHVLAVADHGSLAAAARALGVNHTTVLRRVAAFEKSLGVKLFARAPTGYVLTAAGEEIAASARAMQETVHAIERKIAGRDLRLTGTVRVTTTDTLAVTLMPAALATFAGAHPAIQLELTTTTTMLDLRKRDADVAVRAATAPPQHLVGRRVGPIAFALYASPAYLAGTPARRALEHHAWLAPDDSLASTSIASWMKRTLDVTPVLRADTLTALANAAAAGLGVAALPCYLGDSLRKLSRIRGVIADLSTELWVLTHEDLRRTARVRALTDHLVQALAAQRDALEGRRPRAA
jgi:DNA-binding transcriptional LysR family regulator